MANQSVKSPSGKELFIVANKTLTPESDKSIKQVLLKRETIEVLVSDSRVISMGSQFGHTALEIDGTVYGRAHPGWDVDGRDHYLMRQQVKMHRDTWGYTLSVSPQEKAKVLEFINKQRAENKPYDITDNSCSSNIADALGAAGLIAHDPRWSFGSVVSPADLMAGLSHSKRLVKKATYPKK
ncbi:lipoprotein N-acyltransferase Lnb domain-containing protein [Chromobacterium haemolyticum]|uniref:lipoprotein N-acyltransferase Lnb domain-containing protein n=1 Tax=Chromobacterium haemolyticum TaxID=394935 RepID=UPI0009DA332B|nr:DUF4105 domain-containing protein [Chromobacterium haemolyticum]PTU68629.1 DUF4105 domain-containing protein [Chromobacterium haemolyticum]